LLVNKNDETAGGIEAAISAIISSSITPGPLGIEDTSPNADAPCSTARRASATDEMQQILTLGCIVGCIEIAYERR
jgi:hypothetical protein